MQASSVQFLRLKQKIICLIFSRIATGFHRWTKLFEQNILITEKHFSEGQTRWAKSPQPVKLSSALLQALDKTLALFLLPY